VNLSIPHARGWLALLLAVVALVVVRAVAVAPTTVSSESMAPTLPRGDVVLVDKATWHLRGLHRGDLVIFTAANDETTLKRLVAVGGDTVEIRDAVLYVNARRVAEPYVDHRRIDGLYFGPVHVPRGELFLLGDNRSNSIDSRYFGPVPRDAVVGTAVLGLWPPRTIG
jgi:signal peptidase I